MRDLQKQIGPAQALAPALYTSTTNGTGIDRADYEGVVFVVTSGTVTDGTYAFKIQDSADNSSFSDAAAGDVSGSITNITSSTTATEQKFAYAGPKRYCRLVMTVTGSPGTGGYICAVAIKSGAKVLPTS